MNAIPTVAAVTAVNPLDVLMAGINSNPYFIGIMMLLLNLGGRFLSMEISKEQEKFLSQPLVRRFFLFAILFVATRNVIIAACLAVVVILILGYLFNENSELCVFRSTATKNVTPVGEASSFGLSMEETMILKRLQDKQAHAHAHADAEKGTVEKKDPSAFQYYMSSINQISS